MTGPEIQQISDEIEEALGGRQLGKIFQIGPAAVAIDVFPHAGRYLYISYSPGKAIVYLIRRRLKDLERSASHPTAFSLELKRTCFSMRMETFAADQKRRILRIGLTGDGEAPLSLVIQVGNRPNLLIVSADQMILAAARSSGEAGQRPSDIYHPPEPVEDSGPVLPAPDAGSLSDILDEREQTNEAKKDFDSLAAEALKKLNAEIRKKQKLLQNLDDDLAKHGDPGQWKRYGDLLLANIGSTKPSGDNVIVTDYFDDQMPSIEIPIEKNASPAEMAEIYFARYAKARNGADVIARRQDETRQEIDRLNARLERLRSVIESGDREALSEFLPVKAQPLERPQKKKEVAVKGVRRFISSDGFEILVGKKAVDNDHLTFRVARSLDLWFHAADYPGSHVIIRNPSRKEVPMKTVIEAARLAAFYSDAREMPKAAVRYTPRKFVNKPRRSAPGLVSLASFKTILVEPGTSDLAPAG